MERLARHPRLVTTYRMDPLAQIAEDPHRRLLDAGRAPDHRRRGTRRVVPSNVHCSVFGIQLISPKSRTRAQTSSAGLSITVSARRFYFISTPCVRGFVRGFVCRFGPRRPCRDPHDAGCFELPRPLRRSDRARRAPSRSGVYGRRGERRSRRRLGVDRRLHRDRALAGGTALQLRIVERGCALVHGDDGTSAAANTSIQCLVDLGRGPHHVLVLGNLFDEIGATDRLGEAHEKLPLSAMSISSRPPRVR